LSARECSVLLVEDDAMVRAWLRLALHGSEFRVAGEASTVAVARQLMERRRPDVLLLDQRLPDVSGTEFVKQLRCENVGVRVVMMTANPEKGFNEAAREAGAQGTVLKSGQGDELLGALRRVVAGETAFDVRHPRRPPGQAPLTARERDVLSRVARGATNREIATELQIGDETVKTLLARAFRKLGARRRAEAVTEAHARGLL
jgi:DNA-binding NarL/FixJ family response regulator